MLEEFECRIKEFKKQQVIGFVIAGIGGGVAVFGTMISFIVMRSFISMVWFGIGGGIMMLAMFFVMRALKGQEDALNALFRRANQPLDLRVISSITRRPPRLLKRRVAKDLKRGLLDGTLENYIFKPLQASDGTSHSTLGVPTTPTTPTPTIQEIPREPARSRTRLREMIKAEQRINIDEAIKYINIPPYALERIIYDLVGEGRVAGNFEGREFLIESDLDFAISELESALDTWEARV